MNGETPPTQKQLDYLAHLFDGSVWFKPVTKREASNLITKKLDQNRGLKNDQADNNHSKNPIAWRTGGRVRHVTGRRR